MSSFRIRVKKLEKHFGTKGKTFELNHEQKLELARTMINGNWDALKGKYPASIIEQLREYNERMESRENLLKSNEKPGQISRP